MPSVPDDEITELVSSARGGFGLMTDFTATVVGAGTVYVSFNAPVGDVVADKVTWLKANGIPLVAGQFAEDSLRESEVLYCVADTGDVDVRLTNKGAE